MLPAGFTHAPQTRIIRISIDLHQSCMEKTDFRDQMIQRETEQFTSLPKRSRHRVTFSLDPSLAITLEKYRQNGGNPSRLASRLLSQYFAGEIGQRDADLHLSYLSDQIAEKTAEIKRLAALIEKVEREDEEQKKKDVGIKERQRAAVLTEFADARPNPIFWKRELRLDGFDPDEVIRRRTQSLSGRLGMPVHEIMKMMQEVLPEMMKG